MDAIIWLSIIAISIYLAFKVGSKFSSGSSIEKKKIARRSGFAVTGFWLLWTFGFSTLFVGYALTGPLAIFQTILIIVVFTASYRNFFKEEKFKDLINEKEIEINQLKYDLKEIDNKRLNEMLEKIGPEFIKKIDTGNDHRKILLNSIRLAKNNVIILSGWSTSYSIDKNFRELLRNALKRGVNIYIGYGYVKSNEVKVKGKRELEAEKTLLNLQDWSSKVNTPGILFVREYPNHSKFLSCDYDYVVCGSFNWLSNREFTKNDERSYKFSFSGFVTSEVDEIIDDFENRTSPIQRRSFIKKFIPFSDRP